LATNTVDVGGGQGSSAGTGHRVDNFLVEDGGPESEEKEPEEINPGASVDPDLAVAGPSNMKAKLHDERKEEHGNNQGLDLEASANISNEGKWLPYEDLMSDSYPSKSKVVYLKAFKSFERYLKDNNQWKANTVPTDLQVMNYFHYLRHDLKWAPTTLWSTYARINAVLKRVYGVSLKSFTRVSDILKSYDSGHVVKQAGIFTPQQIEDFVTDPELSSKYWLVRKAVCLIGYYGGFRNVELKSLKFENCELDSMGYWFHFARSKQRGRVEQTSICIPRRQPDWIPVCSNSTRVGLDFDPASLIDLYLAEVESDLNCSRDELKGDFFRATHGPKGQKFTQLTLGKNTISKVGVQVATELCLPRPEIYTGHCWRRSCGTSASDSGVNVTTLMAMMGWSNPKTAMVYVKKSRMTSLSLSLYLANVQRSNCPDPFPRSPSERRQAFKHVQGSKIVAKKEVETSVSTSQSMLPLGSVGLKIEDSEIDSATQALIREIEAEESIQGFESDEIQEVQQGGQLVARSSSGSSKCVAGENEKEGRAKETVVVGNAGNSNLVDQFSSIDSRISGILHNLQNTGNLTIHFHFDGNQK
jgi:integrase